MQNKMNQKQLLPFIVFVFCFLLLNGIVIFNIERKKNEKENVIRLHVVANSNSQEDQIMKLKIASKVEEYIYSFSTNESYSNQDFMKEISHHKDEILNIANTTLKESNIHYASHLNIGNIKYEEKQSVHLDMEPGVYNSVQLVLGNGNGKNFWSLLFPNQDTIEKIAPYESILPGISTIYDTTENIENDRSFSFKLLEIFENIFQK